MATYSIHGMSWSSGYEKLRILVKKNRDNRMILTYDMQFYK